MGYHRISKQNKISTWKLVSNQKMGQLCELDSGGVHRFQGQTFGQNWKPGRRGIERSQKWEVGPTMVARKPPPSGGVGCGAADAGASLPLQVCLMLSGAQQKIAKNIRRMGT